MNEIPIKKVGMPLDEEGRRYDLYPGEYSISRVQEDIKKLRDDFLSWYMDMDANEDAQNYIGFNQLLSKFDKLVDDLEWKG